MLRRNNFFVFLAQNAIVTDVSYLHFNTTFFVGCSNSSSTHSTKSSDVPNDILGIWGSPEGIPVWKIKTDSIYYFGERKNYPIKMVGEDLFIQRPNGSGFLKNISMNNDTLIFYDEEGSKIKAFRVK